MAEAVWIVTTIWRAYATARVDRGSSNCGDGLRHRSECGSMPRRRWN